MKTIQGYWYNSEQSAQQLVVLNINSDGYVNVINQETSTPLFTGHYDTIEWGRRLGNSARYVYFPAGEKFETRDNDSIDDIVQQFSPSIFNTLLYRLESNWRYVFMATLCVLAVGFWAASYGIPMTAKAIAYSLPVDIQKAAGEQTLKALDQQLFTPSDLDEQVQARIRQHFLPIMNEHSEYDLQLYFRASDIGANAFALPGGGIVFTDDMVRLSHNDDELLSVMAHEIGHIVHRHGLQGVIQGSLLGFILMAMSGDTSAVSELFLGIPVLLTQLGYSRNFEHEADDYALAYMNEKGMDQQLFVRLMTRVEMAYRKCAAPIESHENAELVEEPTGVSTEMPIEDEKCDPEGHASSGYWSRYLSTHPSLQERIEKFNHSHSNDH